MHFLYILYSDSLNRYYVGQSSDVEQRIAFHNSERNNIWTKTGKPWVLIAMFDFPTKSDAIVAERFIKKQKSRKVIEKIRQEGYRFKDQILLNIARASDPD